MLKEVFKKSPDRVWQRLCAGTPSQRAIRLSLAIHLGILLLSFGLGLIQDLWALLNRKKEPSLHVFSLESVSSPQAPEGEKSVSSPSTPTTAKKKPSPSIQFKPLPQVKLPSPSPVSKASPPVEKPEKSRSKPNPKPVAKEPSAQKVSYEDFLKAQSKVPTSASKPSASVSSHLKQVLNGALGMPKVGPPLGAYISRMKEAIDQVWQKPSGLKGGIEAVIEFEVDKNGKIQSYKLIKPSLHTLFDASIEKAFQSVSLPPPPDGKNQTFQLTFKSLDS